MEPLAWYIAGPLIGITVPILLIIKEKQLGISSSFRVIGATIFPNWNYFRYDKQKDYWQVFFALGLIVAALLMFQFTSIGDPKIGLATEYASVPVYTTDNLAIFFFGAFLIGFGARYADGCTAGHCIMGNSQFALSSLLTTICFFIGGLIATYWIVPKLFTS